MVIALGSPQPVFTLPPIDEIPDEVEDKPEPGLALARFGSLNIPALAFGAATFSNIYCTEEQISGPTPVRTARLALRYGIDVFDTSPYYGVSEIVLGVALKTLEVEFPRTSYKLITKCGRYGPNFKDFDYSPAAIRASITRSLERLNTPYLDAVYLHDVEFVATQVGPSSGNHSVALGDGRASYGLNEGEEGKIWGEGDQKILDAVAELRKLQEKGVVKAVGLSGYPLPTLLRLALLVLHNPPYKPLDIILSYCHLTLQNSTFISFLPEFRERARISQVLTASPLSMGLLTPSPPKWHPAPERLKAATLEAEAKFKQDGWPGGLVNIGIGYANRLATQHGVPTVAGFSQLREVHESVRVWRALQLQEGVDDEKRAALEQEAIEIYKKSGYLNWSWTSPPPRKG